MQLRQRLFGLLPGDRLGNRSNQTVLLLALLSVFNLILQPPESKVEADVGLVVAVKLVTDVVIGQVPVATAVPLSDIRFNRVGCQVGNQVLVQGKGALARAVVLEQITEAET